MRLERKIVGPLTPSGIHKGSRTCDGFSLRVTENHWLRWELENWFIFLKHHSSYEVRIRGEERVKVSQLGHQFSRSVVSNSLRPHEPQHVRTPCPSPTPGVHPNPCPSSRWCHPTISSSVVPFSCPQSFPASRSFQMSQVFASGGQSIGV